MKYLHQAVILAAVTAAAELIKYLVPLPVPASIYGLLLLFLLLKTGCLKLEQHMSGRTTLGVMLRDTVHFL